MADESCSTKDNIHLCYCHGIIFVWSLKDAIILREQFRIVGTCYGCYPLKPKQNLQMGLPIMLSNVEAKFVLEHQASALLHKTSNFSDAKHLLKYKEEVDKERLIQHKTQTKLKQDQKWNDLDEMADEIKKGKNKKIFRKKAVQIDFEAKCQKAESTFEDKSFTLDDFESFKRNELEKIEQFSFDQTWINMPVESKLPHQHETLTASNIHLSQDEALKYAVFCDLHSQGYFLTDGLKFGGHFLVYPGDPGLYHSIFIVFCCSLNDKLSAADYSALGRLSTSVKKTLLLCSLGDDGKVIYSSLAWSGIA